MKNIAEKYITKLIEEILSHEGSENPISVSELMTIVPLTDREIRRLVSYLVVEELYPIGSKSSKPAGFFRIVDIGDFIEAIANLDPRSKKIEKRALRLAKACRKYGLEIPEVNIAKYKNSTHLSIQITNSVVFIENGKKYVE